MPQSSTTKISLQIIYPKFHLNLPGANVLNCNWLAKLFTYNYKIKDIQINQMLSLDVIKLLI